MADPISAMAIGSMAATAIGGGVKMLGEDAAGKAAENFNRYRAQVAENRRLYYSQAGDVAREEVGLKYKDRLAEEKVAQGAGNLDVFRGSAADVRASTRDVGL